MTSEEAFLIDILASPEDPAPRLVYADWLEDEGNPRAGWVRRGCEVLQASPGSQERWKRREALRALLAAEGHAWPEVDGLVLSWDGVLSVFRYRLAETMVWCSGRGLPFRSEALRSASTIGPFEDWGAGVQRLALRRSEVLLQMAKTPRWLADDLAGGRLLVYRPLIAQEEEQVERPEAEYLDDCHQPGWDTWLAFAREMAPESGAIFPEEYLLAWVPPHLVSDVQEQMRLSPRRCLAWADALDWPFLRRLREAGLSG